VNTPERKFTDLYEKNHKVIYRFIYRHIPDENAASDLMQDTFINFIKIYRDKALPEYEQCRMYLFRTARNLLINHRKSYYNRNVETQPFNETGSPTGVSPVTAEESYILAETVRLEEESLKKAMQELDENERSVLLLRHIDGFPLEKIAAILGVSISTTHRLIKKAESTLLRYYKNFHEDFRNKSD